MKTKAQIEYDNRRKTETRRKLMAAFSDLTKLARHREKPITKAELSKASGVSRRTIDRFPEVISKLNDFNSDISKRAGYIVPIDLDIERITTIEEARAIIKALLDENGFLQKKNAEQDNLVQTMKDHLTAQDLEIAKLKAQVYELKDYLTSTKRQNRV